MHAMAQAVRSEYAARWTGGEESRSLLAKNLYFAASARYFRLASSYSCSAFAKASLCSGSKEPYIFCSFHLASNPIWETSSQVKITACLIIVSKRFEMHCFPCPWDCFAGKPESRIEVYLRMLFMRAAPCNSLLILTERQSLHTRSRLPAEKHRKQVP